MSRLFDDAAGDFLDVFAAAVVTTYPFTVHAWFRSDAAVIQVLFNLRDTGSNTHYFSLELLGGAGDTVNATTKAGGGSQNATTSTSYALDTWNLATGVWASPTDKRAYLNGGGKGTNAVALTPDVPGRTEIGHRSQTGVDFFMSGRIAEVIVLPYAQTDEEVAAWASGINFAWARSLFHGYWPLWGLSSPEPDLSGNANPMVVSGPIKADHAPITLYTPRWAASSIDQIIVPVPPTPPVVDSLLPRYGQERSKIDEPPVFGATILRS